MLVDAGRGQEALGLEKVLLGYLRDDATKKHDVLEGNSAETIVSASKYVLTRQCCFFIFRLLWSWKFPVMFIN